MSFKTVLTSRVLSRRDIEDFECCRAQRRLLTTMHHLCITSDKRNESWDISFQVEMGNTN